MTQVEIPESILEKFKSEVANLQRKAEKLHLIPPQYKIIGSSWKEVPANDGEEVCMTKYFTIEFDAINVVLNDWKVVCRISKNDSNLIGVKNINNAFYYPYEENIPQDCYHKSPSLCEHCGRNISTRKTTYILRNVKTNEYKQVGSSCVKDFVSSTNNIESILNWINVYTDYVREKASENFDNIPHIRYYPTKSFLTLLIRMYSEAGFIPEMPPTNNASYVHPNYYQFDKYLHNHPNFEEDPIINAEIEKILGFVRKSYEKLNEKESLDMYENKRRNAFVAVLAEYMSEDPEYIRQFLYGVSLYYKYHTQELYVGNNMFLGEVGDIVSLRVKLYDIYDHKEGNYGGFYIARFLTHDGYKITSFVSYNNKFALYLEKAHVGHEMIFEARIKGHNEYKGEKTTMVNYIKNFRPYYQNIKEELGVSS